MLDGTITLTIEAELKSVRLIGVTIRCLARAAGFPEKLADLMELSIVEAANNVIRHGYQNRAGNDLEVRVEFNARGVVFQIIDSGRPMTRCCRPNLDFDPHDTANLPEGGFGLFIIHQVMDTVDYVTETGRNILTLTKSFPEANTT